MAQDQPESPRSSMDETAPLLAQTVVAADEDVRQWMKNTFYDCIDNPYIIAVYLLYLVEEFATAMDQAAVILMASTLNLIFEDHRLSAVSIMAYLIANAGCKPLTGQITDIFGTKKALVFAAGVYIAGCALAVAPIWVSEHKVLRFSLYVLARTLMGIGAGGAVSIYSLL